MDKIKRIIRRTLGDELYNKALTDWCFHLESYPARGNRERFALKPYWALYLETLFNSARLEDSVFDDVRTTVIFIGYPRSGHSLVGSLLDAHHNIIISHEADILPLVKRGFSQRQIYSYMLNNSIKCARAGRGWSGNSYDVAGGWAGRFDKLLVIGDKKGGTSTTRIRDDFGLLRAFEKKITARKKYIHHIRNPYDNLGSMARSAGTDRLTPEIIDYYFGLCDTVARIKEHVGDRSVFEGRHEDLIDDPESYIRGLCSFLEVDCPGDFLEKCAAIVEKTPRKAREGVNWDNETVETVRRKISEYNFLEGYTLES